MRDLLEPSRLHGITAAYSHSMLINGPVVRIESYIHSESKTLPLEENENAFDKALGYLKSRGFTIRFYCELEHGYVFFGK